MGPLETTATLAAFERRGPGTDAERRAARRLARDLTGAGYRVTIEPFWCRPNWAGRWRTLGTSRWRLPEASSR